MQELLLYLFSTQNVLYAGSAIGSVSWGYFLLRTGFPITQSYNKVKKLLLSYVLGLIVFGAGIGFAFTVSENFFFAASCFALAVLFLALAIKRVLLQQKDFVPLKKEETYATLPKRVLTSEESGLRIVKQDSNAKKNEQVFKEQETKVNGILSEVAQGTSQFEQKNSDREKEEALGRLRALAKQIKGTEKIDKENKKEESDEGELLEISNEDI